MVVSIVLEIQSSVIPEVVRKVALCSVLLVEAIWSRLRTPTAAVSIVVETFDVL